MTRWLIKHALPALLTLLCLIWLLEEFARVHWLALLIAAVCAVVVVYESILIARLLW